MSKVGTSESKEIVNRLVTSFVVKSRRDRSIYEILHRTKRYKFMDRLNHTWDEVLDSRKFTKIQKGFEDHIEIQKAISIPSNSDCYILSHNDEVDGKLISFDEAIQAVFGFGLASIVYNYTSNKVYLECECSYGPPNRYFGYAH